MEQIISYLNTLLSVCVAAIFTLILSHFFLLKFTQKAVSDPFLCSHYARVCHSDGCATEGKAGALLDLEIAIINACT